MTPAALISMLGFCVLVLSVVGGIIWRLSSALNGLALALKQNTIDERERTDRKIEEAINKCRITREGVRAVAS